MSNEAPVVARSGKDQPGVAPARNNQEQPAAAKRGQEQQNEQQKEHARRKTQSKNNECEPAAFRSQLGQVWGGVWRGLREESEGK